MSRQRDVAFLLLLTLILPSFTSAKHRRPADDTPGNFDFYLLTLSWAQEFCATHPSSRSAFECDTKRHYGLVVHGLWPQNNDGSYPEKCAPARPVAQATVQQMLTIMPDRGLIQHEWATHGTCSGLATADYFSYIQTAFGKVQVPQELRVTTQQSSMSPSEIEQKLAVANHASAEAFRISCSAGELVAVEVCLTKDLQLRECGPAVRDCPASQVMVTSTP